VRVLFLPHRLPYAPNRGDRARGYQFARLLATRTELHVAALVHDDFEQEQADRVRALGAASVTTFRVPYTGNYIRGAARLLGTRPLTHSLLDSPAVMPTLTRLVETSRPDVLLTFCSSMARFAMTPPLDALPLVIDMIDVDSVKWHLLSQTARWPMNWVFRREERYLGAFERRAALHAEETLVVNEREQAALLALAPEAKVTVMKVGVDLHDLQPTTPPVSAPRVVFCGVMNYTPNVEGVQWFVREVWPLVRARRHDAQFFVVGSQPADAIRRLHSPLTGVVVTGTVPDVRPYLWDASVGVAPLKTARGVQNKVLESVAAGLPSVVTSPVMEGLPAEVSSACRVADSANDFADALLAFLAMSGPDRRALAATANLGALSWESQTAPLYGVLENAARHHKS
jgi:sugar transferase (PEP-CTERM/EpsH1 system associated)